FRSFEKALHALVEGEIAPLTVTRAAMGAATKAAHVVIEAAPASRGLVVLDSRGPASLSENVEIVVGQGADLTVVSLQEWADDARHLASHFARLARDAKLTHIVVSLGGAIVRVNPSAHLAAEGSDAEMYGVYFANASPHLEQRVYVHHDAPHNRSPVTSQGDLNDAGPRTAKGDHQP